MGSLESVGSGGEGRALSPLLPPGLSPSSPLDPEGPHPLSPRPHSPRRRLRPSFLARGVGVGWVRQAWAQPPGKPAFSKGETSLLEKSSQNPNPGTEGRVASRSQDSSAKPINPSICPRPQPCAETDGAGCEAGSLPDPSHAVPVPSELCPPCRLTEKRRVIRAYLFSDQYLPPSSFISSLHSPSTFSLTPPPTSASFRTLRKQVGGAGEQENPHPRTAHPCIHPAYTWHPRPDSSSPPFSTQPRRWHTCLPPHLHLAQTSPFRAQVDAPGSLSKMAPRTLH